MLFAQMLQHNVVKSQNVIISVMHIASITQAAAVITSTSYSISVGTYIYPLDSYNVQTTATLEYYRYTEYNTGKFEAYELSADRMSNVYPVGESGDTDSFRLEVSTNKKELDIRWNEYGYNENRCSTWHVAGILDRSIQMESSPFDVDFTSR